MATDIDDVFIQSFMKQNCAANLRIFWLCLHDAVAEKSFQHTPNSAHRPFQQPVFLKIIPQKE